MHKTIAGFLRERVANSPIRLRAPIVSRISRHRRRGGWEPMPDILEYCKGRKVETFKSGATLIKQGGEDRKLFVLVEGQVEVLRQDTQVSYIEEPGSLFGEMSVLLDMPYSANVKALSNVKAYVIDDAIHFLSSKPEIALELAALLARRLYYTTSYLVDLQQQAAGRREDLDVVDKILAQLVQSPDDVRSKKKK
jgi:CRP/FNR family cyclic AMP-dependent transcriptional regulator